MDTLVATNIRINGQRLELKFKGLGWVDAFDPALKQFKLVSTIYGTKYRKVLRLAIRKGIVKAEKWGNMYLIKGGLMAWLAMVNQILKPWVVT